MGGALDGADRSQYGVRGFDFVPLAGISAYTLLDQGDVLAADVFTTDPQLLTNKYVQLATRRTCSGSSTSLRSSTVIS